MSIKVYVFPAVSGKRKNINPYIKCVLHALTTYGFTVQNKTAGRFGAVLAMWPVLKSDIILVNWPENVGERKGSFFQSMIFCSFLISSYFLKRKVVWVLHNKISHRNNTRLGRLCLLVTQKVAKVVVTHSSEGLLFYKEKYSLNNITFFPHPIYPDIFKKKNRSIKNDIVIWGKIERYKGILEFLEYIWKKRKLSDRSISIYGNCDDEDYLTEINRFVNKMPNVTLYNEYIEETELSDILSTCKVILFTYLEASTLSSGALIYSLPFEKKIIAPNIGAFKDLGSDCVIDVYETYDDIGNLLINDDNHLNQIHEYIKTYTWTKYIEHIDRIIHEKDCTRLK